MAEPDRRGSTAASSGRNIAGIVAGVPTALVLAVAVFVAMAWVSDRPVAKQIF